MTKLRVYPLRLTKKKWCIPIYIRHECSDRCARIFVEDPNHPCHFILQHNPDYSQGKCSNYDKIERGAVRMADFDPTNPQGTGGLIYNPDEIVIPDQEIHIDINYPLTNSVQVTVDFGHPRITRRELLFMITSLYKHIYEEEEKTSPTTAYTVAKQCGECEDKDVTEYVVTFTPKTQQKSDECPICFQDYMNEKAAKLPCGHIFHDSCVNKWLGGEDDKNSCPLCRESVMKCDDCEGKRYTYEQYESVVIPVEHRGFILNRNHTFGLFGIYGHDLEDLGIERLAYDRETKKLRLGIYS